MPIIDVHTHMFTRSWFELLRRKGKPYGIKVRPDGKEEIFRGETPVVFPQPGHFDYALRLKQMDAAGIDVSIVSLTCPIVSDRRTSSTPSSHCTSGSSPFRRNGLSSDGRRPVTRPSASMA